MRKPLSPPTYLCPTFWGGRMLPDLPLHQVRLLLDHAAAGCSPFPPLLLFKPLLPVPPGFPWSAAGCGSRVLPVWAPASRYSDGSAGILWTRGAWVPTPFPNTGLWGRLVSPSALSTPFYSKQRPHLLGPPHQPSVPFSLFVAWAMFEDEEEPLQGHHQKPPHLPLLSHATPSLGLQQAPRKARAPSQPASWVLAPSHSLPPSLPLPGL